MNESLILQIRDASEMIEPDSRKIFCDIIEDHQLREHEGMMLRSLRNLPSTLPALFDYGIKYLPESRFRPDEALGSYFFIISAISLLPDDLRDLAMEAMIYCKNSADVPTWSLLKLRQTYNSLLPKLHAISN